MQRTSENHDMSTQTETAIAHGWEWGSWFVTCYLFITVVACIYVLTVLRQFKLVAIWSLSLVTASEHTCISHTKAHTNDNARRSRSWELQRKALTKHISWGFFSPEYCEIRKVLISAVSVCAMFVCLCLLPVWFSGLVEGSGDIQLANPKGSVIFVGVGFGFQHGMSCKTVRRRRDSVVLIWMQILQQENCSPVKISCRKNGRGVGKKAQFQKRFRWLRAHWDKWSMKVIVAVYRQ